MEYSYKRFSPLEHLTDHLTTGPNLIQVILGPRQVGKTTAITQYLEESNWAYIYDTADLLSPPTISWIEDKWIEARNIAKKNGMTLLVLDEVQKITLWSEAVKKFHDEDVKSGIDLRVVLLGSSALMVQKGLKESLAGRFEIIPFTHWTFAECRDAFQTGLDEYIFFGGYPGAFLLYQSSGDEQRWQAYVRDALIETVIGKDIILLKTIEKPALFRQIFHLATAHPAEILAYNKMLGQLQDVGNTTTIASYLQVMLAAGLLNPVSKYSGSAIRQRSSSPKLVLLNNALINASMAREFKETRNNPQLWGRLVENAVGAHLYNYLSTKGVELFYWREREDEVDYVLRKGTKILGIEVKSGRQRSGRGLKAFSNKYKNSKIFVIGGDKGDYTLENFFLMSPEDLFKEALKNYRSW